MLKLDNKVALVTGSSRGIGRATVLALSRAGAAVVINYARNREAAEQLLAEVEGAGGQGLVVQADVSVYEESEKLVRASLEHFNRIDILVNNAGVNRDNLLIRMKPEEWHEVIDVNLTGTFNTTRAVMRPMLKQKSGGRIVNVASVAGIYGNSGQVNYAAAKGGVIAFTRSLAKEIGSRGITVNAVAPGFIETEMTAVLSDGLKEQALQNIPLARFGKPEDVAELILFLAAAGHYITGQVIAVDGGLVM
ncbi:MAG: 3-oxoacyl-[acyl-carrier-protein] reductase [Dethiobacteria bacterium]|jgi:3-oxoacyl-[acyl-carrier protein] reductase|nr:3-oxoacyl-[acyl-carrier-protein] reductase [Bacillota bacterium]NMD32865.1 3-oxoacyl-[acyl-carrier-protein] reductase [Bacillota bacterium]HOB28909.1 3-oxoacyl-[acyl-carrier-protein] reductase [Bacillota bacterium]HPZ41473.1 3-oxoacyl-[acyl-carrier-protein] reductase [Bacillota bacterium]HQD52425.1 3-oxoacyl-[acyl-carrier-protein] reductase [Bacillota bacterium]